MPESAQRRIASLDGARAIAVGMVVIAHVGASHTFEPARSFWRIDLGNLGVRFFFVISGFVITTLLLRERNQMDHKERTSGVHYLTTSALLAVSSREVGAIYAESVVCTVAQLWLLQPQ